MWHYFLSNNFLSFSYQICVGKRCLSIQALIQVFIFFFFIQPIFTLFNKSYDKSFYYSEVFYKNKLKKLVKLINDIKKINSDNEAHKDASDPAKIILLIQIRNPLSVKNDIQWYDWNHPFIKHFKLVFIAIRSRLIQSFIN